MMTMAMAMQPPRVRTRYDVASAVSIGRRDCQEDAIVTDFPQGAEHGFVVLADGMGGHAAGDIASRIVVTEVFSELKLRSGDPDRLEADINRILRNAAATANDCVQAHTRAFPRTSGMGATLLAPVLLRDRLFWISVGDSPLLLYRDGILTQLNEDHSMGPQIDHMVRSGLMAAERARNHPDRNCLTSVLIGRDIAHIDCPSEPLLLRDGDIVIAASDGLQFLDQDEIAASLAGLGDAGSTRITETLMRRIEALADPDQDNVSVSVIRVSQGERRPRPVQAPAPGPAADLARFLRQVPKHAEVTVMASKTRSGVAMVCRMILPQGRPT